MWPEGEAERGRGMERCGCVEGPRSAASSASPASAESWLLACLVTRPFRVNRTEASWNQNTHKSWPLWKTLPRSINTLEVVIDMWEGSVALLASIGRQTTTWILSPGKFQALADVCWHTYMWHIETLLPPALCTSLLSETCPRVQTRDYRQVHYLHQFSILSFNANPPLPADDGKARVGAVQFSCGRGRINTQGSNDLSSCS